MVLVVVLVLYSFELYVIRDSVRILRGYGMEYLPRRHRLKTHMHAAVFYQRHDHFFFRQKDMIIQEYKIWCCSIYLSSEVLLIKKYTSKLRTASAAAVNKKCIFH